LAYLSLYTPTPKFCEISLIKMGQKLLKKAFGVGVKKAEGM